MPPADSSGRPAPGRGKRRSPRAARRIAVKYGETRADRHGYANNVSVDGLYLQGARLMPGTVVFLEIELGGQHFTLVAQARWMTATTPSMVAMTVSRGVGLRILNPSPEWAAAVAPVTPAAG